MSDMGGPESFAPGEGAGAGLEQLSEEAKLRFAAAAAALQAIQREEKRSKKRDTRVARTIIQFLNDDRYAHLFVLISRLVARDCPSVFILAVLSLINTDCLAVVEEYLAEELKHQGASVTLPSDVQLTQSGRLEAATQRSLVEWITRMQMVLSLEGKQILLKLMVDDRNIDGTVLQLATFVLQEFFQMRKGPSKSIPFEHLHSLTGSILQTVFEPFMSILEGQVLTERKGGDEVT